MSSTRPSSLAWVLLVAGPAMMSVNYIVARSAASEIPPHLLAFLRWLTAFAVMLPFALPALRRQWPAWRSEWRQGLLLGAFGMWICGAWVYEGGRSTSATNIALLYAVAPVMIAVGAARLFGERMTGPQKLGVLLALSGTLLVIAKGSLDNVLAVRLVVGDLWIAGAVVSWTAYALLLRRLHSVLAPLARLTVICAGGLVVLAPFTAAEWLLMDAPVLTGKGVMLAVIAGLLPGFGAYQAHLYVQRELGPARASLVLYLGPVWAAILGWLWLDELPQWYHCAAAGLILPGIFLATRGGPESVAESGDGPSATDDQTLQSSSMSPGTRRNA